MKVLDYYVALEMSKVMVRGWMYSKGWYVEVRPDGEWMTERRGRPVPANFFEVGLTPELFFLEFIQDTKIIKQAISFAFTLQANLHSICTL